MTTQTRRQTDFNTVWQHFIVERNPLGQDETGACAYYAVKDGKEVCCVIGRLLGKDTAKEIRNVRKAIVSKEIRQVLPPYMDKDLDFYDLLQYAHDNARNLKELRENLITLAEGCELDLPQI